MPESASPRGYEAARSNRIRRNQLEQGYDILNGTWLLRRKKGFPQPKAARSKNKRSFSNLCEPSIHYSSPFRAALIPRILRGRHIRQLVIERLRLRLSPPAFRLTTANKRKSLFAQPESGMNLSRPANLRIRSTWRIMPIGAISAKTNYSAGWKRSHRNRISARLHMA